MNRDNSLNVLVIGATGKLGSRLLPSLLQHGHKPFAFVRDPNKLESLLPCTLLSSIKIIQGDATKQDHLVKCMIKNDIDAVILTAKSIPDKENGQKVSIISMTTSDACIQAGKEMKKVIRGW